MITNFQGMSILFQLSGKRNSYFTKRGSPIFRRFGLWLIGSIGDEFLLEIETITHGVVTLDEFKSDGQRRYIKMRMKIPERENNPPKGVYEFHFVNLSIHESKEGKR